MDNVKKFCELAVKKGVEFSDMIGCIDSIRSGQRMSKKESKACDFLSEENTFWNPCKSLDYNWFLDHFSDIEAEMG